MSMKNKININNFLTYSIYLWYFFLIVVGLIVGSSAGDDHGDYIINWQRSLIDRDPWQEADPVTGQINIYGPLHPLMSFIYYFHPILPKFFYMLMFTLSNLYIFNLLKKRGYFNAFSNILFFFLAIPFNFLFINYIFIFGHNDALVFGLIVFGLVFRIQNRHALSAIFITLSILEKYYTVVLVPFIILDYFINKNFKDLYKFIIFSIMTALIVMLLTFLLYGFNLNFLYNYFTANSSTGVFSYLSSFKWYIDLFNNRLGHLDNFYDLLLKTSFIIMLIVYFSFLYFSISQKFKLYFSMSIALWIVFTLHSGSFMTYYIVVISLFAMIPLEENENLYTKLQNIALPYFIYLSVSSFLYLFASDGYGEILGHMRNISGFVNLFFSFFSIFFLISILLLAKHKQQII